MSATFDEVVAASWTRYEQRLLAWMRAAADGYVQIDPAAQDEHGIPFVTIDWDENGLDAELVGLSARHDFEVLESLGWRPLEHPDGSPFWGVAMSVDEVEVLAGMVSGALRFVFGVADPVFVSSEPYGRPASLPPRPTEEVEDNENDENDDVFDEGAAIGFPDSHDELLGMVERSLARIYGSDVIRDDDGDFPINTGVVPVWIRVQEDTPIVRLFSYVVRSVRDIRQARIEVGILNRRTSLLKFHLDDGVITASYELPAAPFMGPQLMYTLDSITETLNDLAPDAALRVGGKLWFDGIEGSSSSDVEETA